MDYELYNNFKDDKIICPYCKREIIIDDPQNVPYEDGDEKEYRCHHCYKVFNIIAQIQDVVWSVKKIEDKDYLDFLDENDD